MKVRIIKDRDTGRYHYSICFPNQEIVHNRRARGYATRNLASRKADSMVDRIKSLTGKVK